MLSRFKTWSFILAFTSLASPAIAEVCDKVRPRWRPHDGVVNQFGELYFFFTSPFGLVLIAVLALAIYFKNQWLSWSAAALFGMTAVLNVAGVLWPSDGVALAAIAEGCRDWPVLNIIVLVLTIVFLIQSTKPRVTERLNTVDLVGDGDDVDLLEAIERAFDLKLTDDEASDLETIGDLYHLVKAKVKSNPDFDPVWELVCQIVRENSLTRDPIDNDTTFFSKDAKKRE